MGNLKKILRAGLTACCALAMAQAAMAEVPSVKTYKQNFFLTAFDSIDQMDGRQQEEAKFQISLKKKLFDWAPLFVGYTQKSFWQIYNGASSKPFRENNFNPEGFVDFGWNAWDNRQGLQIGLEHESNGRGFETDESGNRINNSRSWNRFYIQPKLRIGDRVLTTLKVWHRFQEGEKTGPDDPKGDDNPDIEKFLGHAELRFAASICEDDACQLLSMIRKGRGDPHGTVQLDFIFNPSLFDDGVYFQIHYFNGFGESLIDYNRRVKKIGIGFAVGNPFISSLPQ